MLMKFACLWGQYQGRSQVTGAEGRREGDVGLTHSGPPIEVG